MIFEAVIIFLAIIGFIFYAGIQIDYKWIIMSALALFFILGFVIFLQGIDVKNPGMQCPTSNQSCQYLLNSSNTVAGLTSDNYALTCQPVTMCSSSNSYINLKDNFTRGLSLIMMIFAVFTMLMLQIPDRTKKEDE